MLRYETRTSFLIVMPDVCSYTDFRIPGVSGVPGKKKKKSSSNERTEEGKKKNKGKERARFGVLKKNTKTARSTYSE